MTRNKTTFLEVQGDADISGAVTAESTLSVTGAITDTGGINDPNTSIVNWTPTVTRLANDSSTTGTGDTNLCTQTLANTGTYTFEIYGVIQTLGTGSIVIGVGGTAAITSSGQSSWSVQLSSGDQAASLATTSLPSQGSWAPGAASTAIFKMCGTLVVTATGTITIAYHAGTSGQGVEVRYGTFLRLQRIS